MSCYEYIKIRLNYYMYSVYIVLEVFSRNALYIFTFYLTLQSGHLLFALVSLFNIL